MARYCPLFSGSSGNCTYLGTPQGGILIDVGVSAKRIKQALCERSIDPCSIAAIFVTHEHSDHITGLRVLTKQFGIPVYASQGTMEALAQQDKISPQSPGYVMDGVVNAAGMQVEAFATPHDSRQSCGYRVTFPDERVAVIATDIGWLSPEVTAAVQHCDLLHIESNHDVRMLECGAYPYVLKQRILGRRGHLSNESCAALLPCLLSQGTTRFTLAHLSRENNTPELAQITSVQSLTAAGAADHRDYLLTVATPDATLPVTVF